MKEITTGGFILIYLLTGFSTGIFLIRNINKEVKEKKYSRSKYASNWVIILVMLFCWPFAVIASLTNS